MNAQHTPGPWKKSYDKGCYTDIITEKDSSVICSVKIHYCENHPEYTANTRLIASAPAMLEALEAIFKECAITHKHWGDGCNQKQADAAIKAGEDAIRQAKGEQ